MRLTLPILLCSFVVACSGSDTDQDTGTAADGSTGDGAVQDAGTPVDMGPADSGMLRGSCISLNVCCDDHFGQGGVDCRAVAAANDSFNCALASDQYCLIGQDAGPDAGPPADGGPPADAGSVDAGGPSDGGGPGDGPDDAGGPGDATGDAGQANDGGGRPDLGGPLDMGRPDLSVGDTGLVDTGPDGGVMNLPCDELGLCCPSIQGQIGMLCSQAAASGDQASCQMVLDLLRTNQLCP